MLTRALKVAVLSSLALGGCEAAPEPVCDRMMEGVAVVRSGGQGAWEREGLRPELVELWRRGGNRPGEELAFPVSSSASAAGRFATADFRLSEVVVIEPDGTWSGPWARPGGGPGEIATPVAATWSENGTLAVFDIVNAKVVYLRDGQPAARDRPVDPRFTSPVIASGELNWAGVQPNGAVLLSPSLRPFESEAEGERREAVILRLAPGAVEPDTVSRAVLPTVVAGGFADWPVPGWPRPVAAVGARGVLAVGATDGSYGVLVSDSIGTPIHQICRTADAAPLSAAERGDSAPDGFEALAAAVRAAPRPPSPSPFGRLVVGAEGRVWVQRSRPPAYPGSLEALYGRPGTVHDVFDAEGSLLGEVRMPPGASLQAARGDTIWAFESGEYDEVSVVAYALELRAAPR